MNAHHEARRESHWLAQFGGAIGWPVLMGLAGCSLFYVAIYRGPLNLPVMHRYFAAHPVSFCETALFFVGFAALILKLIEVALQATLMSELPLGTGEERLPVEGAGQLMERLDAAGERVRESHLGKRVREALHHIKRSGSVAGLEEELKYLADQDEGQQHESYALVRIVIWAIPMLGFLGTVMGIAQALGNLDPQQLATDPTNAMQGLLAGLYVAFDTTAVALTQSIFLMFLQFPIDRVELQLLGRVTDRTSELLLGRFQAAARNLDPHLASIERMCYAVMRSVESIVERQADLWRGSLSQMHQQWNDGWAAGGESLQQALSASLRETLSAHAEQLEQIEQRATAGAAERWAQWQGRLESTAQLLSHQQSAFQQQGELLSRVVEATGDVIQLEKTLNENLRELAGAKHFEDTVMSLSAAIQLLSTRLGPATDGRRVELRSSAAQQERAA